MKADFSRIPMQTDEEMRAVRLARGLRAVAASVIIGGIVIAAFEADPTAERSTSRGAGVVAAEDSATGVPLASPTQVARCRSRHRGRSSLHSSASNGAWSTTARPTGATEAST